MPHHRFIDYSKSQLNYKIRQQKAAGINVKLHQYRGDIPVAQINSDKKLDLLLPNRDLTEKNQKLGQTFKKAKKPELFPVKDEHKNPCSYLRKNHSVLNQRNVSRKTTKSSDFDPSLFVVFRLHSQRSCVSSKRIQLTSRRGRRLTSPSAIQARNSKPAKKPLRIRSLSLIHQKQLFQLESGSRPLEAVSRSSWTTDLRRRIIMLVAGSGQVLLA